MGDWLKENGGGEFLAVWGATLIMTVVNYLIPWLLAFVDGLEQWDFASEALSAELWKNFYTSLLNIVFFIGVNAQVFL